MTFQCQLKSSLKKYFVPKPQLICLQNSICITNPRSIANDVDIGIGCSNLVQFVLSFCADQIHFSQSESNGVIIASANSVIFNMLVVVGGFNDTGIIGCKC